ncbi:unnamed protein product [Didymodactylos carnosus]|uniref:Uncharacterized protein n=1 Tax=Didymodactylos carnosus TaxID=1234261 RepID=A0A8S2DT57_9BILA|nr:unnamed protein product [Didymodactylos carnosus]CAF3771839.1 unnamed protein product [Didymodactylos carnosus]
MSTSTTNKQQANDDDNKEEQIQLRSRAASETSTLRKSSHRKRKYSLDIPKANSPKKKSHSGRKVIMVNEKQQDLIR